MLLPFTCTKADVDVFATPSVHFHTGYDGDHDAFL